MDFTKILNIVIRAAVAQVTRILVNSAAGVFRRGMRGMSGGTPSPGSSSRPDLRGMPPATGPQAAGPSPDELENEARRLRREAAIARRATRGN